jgi:hypothetical protein
MLQEVQDACTALESLSSSILATIPVDAPLNTHYGWVAPALSRWDLAGIPSKLADQLRRADPVQLDQQMLARLSALPSELQSLQSGTLPLMNNGNIQGAVAPIMSTLFGLKDVLEPILGWQSFDRKALPPDVSRRINSINAGLNNLVPDFDALRAHVELIDRAKVSAEDIPVTLDELNALKEQVREKVASADRLFEETIEKNVKIETAMAVISEKERAATQLVEKCEEAYRITTTKGLADSFAKKAESLEMSLYAWVGLLLIALVVGAVAGAHRFNLISDLITKPDVKVQLIWVHFGLALVSVGAPIWFAWLATKQISQRFKLAEDYAFKASVAKAYEGYRKEAVSRDEKFQAELFASALKRLDEAPIRLVDQANHGSPWSELLASPAVGKALDAAPDLKDKIIGLANLAVERLAGGTQSATKKSVETEPSEDK